MKEEVRGKNIKPLLASQESFYFVCHQLVYNMKIIIRHTLLLKELSF